MIGSGASCISAKLTFEKTRPAALAGENKFTTFASRVLWAGPIFGNHRVNQFQTTRVLWNRVIKFKLEIIHVNALKNVSLAVHWGVTNKAHRL